MYLHTIKLTHSRTLQFKSNKSTPLSFEEITEYGLLMNMTFRFDNNRLSNHAPEFKTVLVTSVRLYKFILPPNMKRVSVLHVEYPNENQTTQESISDDELKSYSITEMLY